MSGVRSRLWHRSPLIAGLTVAAAIAAASGVAPAATEPNVIATSAMHGPVALKSGPVTIALNPPSGTGDTLVQRLAAVKSGGTLRLTLSGQHTNVQPEVLYEVYLGLPAGAAPSRNSGNFVGTFNFFNTVLSGQGDSQPGSPAGALAFSYDVTDLVASLRTRKLVGDAMNVTIVPAGPPNAGAHPVVGEIALVVD